MTLGDNDMRTYDRGSEWRRWELHIHTPGTLKNDQFIGNSLAEKWDKYYEEINKYIGDGSNSINDIAVVAITDYISIDNYKKVVSDDKLPSSVKLILPNIELRIAPIASKSPVNIHCIFSNKIASDLEGRFLSKLYFTYNQRKYSAVSQDLIELGKKFENDRSLDDLSAKKKGAQQFIVNLDNLRNIFKDDHELKENSIIVVSNNSHDGVSGITSHCDYFINSKDSKGSQLDATRQAIYQLSSAIFSSNAKDIKYFTGEGVDSKEEVVRKCGSLKPCFHGSDAHSNKKIFNPDSERYCWIKSNPTFFGLKQAINEPKERVYIGREPESLSRVRMNATKYISKLSISKTSGKEDQSNKWFEDIQLPLNSGLVAIIGNKGNGKSALADIIGLCADSDHQMDFSFLKKDKFLKKGLAEHFAATIEFVSGKNTESKYLSEQIKETSLPLVQYLPQSYFETVCNEIDKVEYLRNEIEKVVFQYIPQEKRFQQVTFKDLIDFKTRSIDKEISDLEVQLNDINKKIINYEDQSTPNFIQDIKNKLAEKEEELEVHTAHKPQVPAIEQGSEKVNTQQREKLEKLDEQFESITNTIKKTQTKIAKYALAIEELNQLKREIESEKVKFNIFVQRKEEVAKKYEIDIGKIFQVSTNTSVVEDKIKVYEELSSHITNNLLGNSDYDKKTPYDKLLLYAKKNYLNNEISKIKKELTTVEKQYQAYISEQKKWEEHQREIVGNHEIADTLKYYEYKLKFINEVLPNQLSEYRKSRLALSREIYRKKREIKSIYDEVKKNVSTIFDKEDNNQNLTIESSFSLANDFIERFMNYVNKSRSGSFKGKLEGKAMLRDRLISSLNLENEQSILDFLSNIIDYLEEDKRVGNDLQKYPIKDQIFNREDLYLYLFSLKFIFPHYALRQNGKDLEELSPGEKGALLLVFYLVLDKTDIPLIIDQPEDNLDNQSVAKILVPYIKDAKKRRQIIMVTHNPNLAVVSDAEQIIYANIDKAQGNIFSCLSGSIENTEINSKIVDVLEGTLPAFVSRELKYYKEPSLV